MATYSKEEKQAIPKIDIKMIYVLKSNGKNLNYMIYYEEIKNI